MSGLHLSLADKMDSVPFTGCYEGLQLLIDAFGEDGACQMLLNLVNPVDLEIYYLHFYEAEELEEAHGISDRVTVDEFMTEVGVYSGLYYGLLQVVGQFDDDFVTKTVERLAFTIECELEEF